ncbi:MAG: alpha-E domain-containing protein [Bacteroidetes bacterium]|nr:MAG: alpha-E domain-containing protein [Bacteroidota bacterium]
MTALVKSPDMIMLSRVADSLFWLNRYLERTDGLVRTLRSFYILSFDKDTDDELGYLPALACFTSLPPDKAKPMAHQSAEVLQYCISNSANLNSVKVLLSKARENARGSQDKVTKELWEQVNGMYHYILKPTVPQMLAGPDALQVLDKLHEQCLLYSGVIDTTMPRGLGWSFMNIGRYIERCLQTVDITEVFLQHINNHLDGPEDTLYWRRLLLSLSGYELFLKSNRTAGYTRHVVHQVVFNKQFPRSILYSLNRIDKYLDDLTNDNPLPAAISLQKQFGRLNSMVEFTDVQQLTDEGIKQLLGNIRRQVWEFSGAMSKLFFSYA